MLGDEQWEWLDGVLRGSTADVTLIVSSVQLLTSNPLVESWGECSFSPVAEGGGAPMLHGVYGVCGGHSMCIYIISLYARHHLTTAR